MFDTCYNLHFKSVDANSEMLAFLLPLMFCNSKTKNPKHEYMSPSTLFSPLTQNVRLSLPQPPVLLNPEL